MHNDPAKTDSPSAAARTDPAMLRFRTVGFDLDGTLLDTAPDIATAINHALRLAGRPALPFEAVRPMIGGGAKRLLARALANGRDEHADPGILEPLYAELLAHYRANIAVETRPYDGLLRALDRLADAGVALGVATNKLESLARQLLGVLGLADRFTCILGGDTLGAERAKPRPDMLLEMARRCGDGPAAFIGDSIYDTQAARAADLPCVAVSFGYRTHPLSELRADAVITHFDELIPALMQL